MVPLRKRHWWLSRRPRVSQQTTPDFSLQSSDSGTMRCHEVMSDVSAPDVVMHMNFGRVHFHNSRTQKSHNNWSQSQSQSITINTNQYTKEHSRLTPKAQGKKSPPWLAIAMAASAIRGCINSNLILISSSPRPGLHQASRQTFIIPYNFCSFVNRNVKYFL